MRYRGINEACLTLVALSALLTGCNTPRHSNVLIFATSTKGGIDISYDPKTQEPGLVVGYKRYEGVWMPLLANQGPDGKTPATNTNMLYQGTEGTGEVGKDTYSILASFGATFTAEASKAGGPEAAGALAQFFATGLAARKLAGQGYKLLSIQPSDAAEAKQRAIEEWWKEGRQLEEKAKYLIEKIPTPEEFEKCVALAEVHELVDGEDVASLTEGLNDDSLKVKKAELKEYMRASDKERVENLGRYVKVLEAYLEGRE